VGEAIELAVADGGGVENECEGAAGLGEGEPFKRNWGQGELGLERDGAAGNEGLVVDEVIRLGEAGEGAGGGGVFEPECKEKAGAVVESGALAVRYGKGLESGEEPPKGGLAGRLEGLDPLAKRRVGFDGPLLAGGRRDDGEEGSETVGVGAPLPIDVDGGSVAGGERTGDFVGVDGGDGRAVDAGNLGFLEGGEVRFHAGETVGEAGEEPCRKAGGFGAVGVGAEEKKRFMEADEAVGIIEARAGESREETFEGSGVLAVALFPGVKAVEEGHPVRRLSISQGRIRGQQDWMKVVLARTVHCSAFHGH
jgi:hypothetical protein